MQYILLEILVSYMLVMFKVCRDYSNLPAISDRIVKEQALYEKWRIPVDT
jgi:hypothetical protein